MWVFGYGSLIWDGWEKNFNCLQRVRADLPGYRRRFNKASVKNWGTPTAPGPTLNISAEPDSMCQGVAFNFPSDESVAITRYLRNREGKGFLFNEVLIKIEVGTEVSAIVALYCGENIIEASSAGELAAMVLKAAGKSGPCLLYVRELAEKLRVLDISDPEVVGLVDELKKLVG